MGTGEIQHTIVIALSWFREGTCIHTPKMQEMDSNEAGASKHGGDAC